MSAKEDILRLTAIKFFPKWDITTGEQPQPWAILKSGTTHLEVHIPKTIALDKFEEEAWWQFKRLRDDFDMAQVGNGE